MERNYPKYDITARTKSGQTTHPDIIIRDEAIKKAKSKLLLTAYGKYYTDHPELYLYSDLDSDIIPYIEDECRSSLFAFVTVNTDPSKCGNPGSLLPYLQRFDSYNWVKQWIAVIEYHTETGGHIHIHMLIEKQESKKLEYKKSRVEKRFQDIFKEYISNPLCIDVKSPKDPRSKLSYIMGKKSNKDKLINVEKDKIWRKGYGIPDYLGNWCVEPLLVDTPPMLPGFEKLKM